MNTGRSKELYPVKQLMVDDYIPETTKSEKQIESKEIKEPKSKTKKMLNDIVEHSKQLFVPPILKFTTISISINFTFHIGYDS